MVPKLKIELIDPVISGVDEMSRGHVVHTEMSNFQINGK